MKFCLHNNQNATFMTIKYNKNLNYIRVICFIHEILNFFSIIVVLKIFVLIVGKQLTKCVVISFPFSKIKAFANHVCSRYGRQVVHERQVGYH